MWEGVLALLLFYSFIFMWPKLIQSVDHDEENSDLIKAEIRLARWHAGENPWPELKENVETDDDKHL